MYISRKKGACATLFKPSFPMKRGIFGFREHRRLAPASPTRNQCWELFLRRDIICKGSGWRVLWDNVSARVKKREWIFRDTLKRETSSRSYTRDVENKYVWYWTLFFMMGRARVLDINIRWHPILLLNCEWKTITFFMILWPGFLLALDILLIFYVIWKFYT